MSREQTKDKLKATAALIPQPALGSKTAKLFKNGRSQAVRLPKEFRFEGTEVLVRRDEATGAVIVEPKPIPAPEPPELSFDDWFALYDAIPDDAPEEEYAKLPPQPRNLTTQQLYKIFDRADYPEEFFERHTSMPRELNLF
jgi:antitoxin VapB